MVKKYLGRGFFVYFSYVFGLLFIISIKEGYFEIVLK